MIKKGNIPNNVAVFPKLSKHNGRMKSKKIQGKAKKSVITLQLIFHGPAHAINILSIYFKLIQNVNYTKTNLLLRKRGNLSYFFHSFYSQFNLMIFKYVFHFVFVLFNFACGAINQSKLTNFSSRANFKVATAILLSRPRPLK